MPWLCCGTHHSSTLTSKGSVIAEFAVISGPKVATQDQVLACLPHFVYVLSIRCEDLPAQDQPFLVRAQAKLIRAQAQEAGSAGVALCVEEIEQSLSMLILAACLEERAGKWFSHNGKHDMFRHLNDTKRNHTRKPQMRSQLAKRHSLSRQSKRYCRKHCIIPWMVSFAVSRATHVSDSA